MSKQPHRPVSTWLAAPSPPPSAPLTSSPNRLTQRLLRGLGPPFPPCPPAPPHPLSPPSRARCAAGKAETWWALPLFAWKGLAFSTRSAGLELGPNPFRGFNALISSLFRVGDLWCPVSWVLSVDVGTCALPTLSATPRLSRPRKSDKLPAR
jgi:hypothetical protein